MVKGEEKQAQKFLGHWAPRRWWTSLKYGIKKLWNTVAGFFSNKPVDIQTSLLTKIQQQYPNLKDVHYLDFGKIDQAHDEVYKYVDFDKYGYRLICLGDKKHTYLAGQLDALLNKQVPLDKLVNRATPLTPSEIAGLDAYITPTHTSQEIEKLLEHPPLTRDGLLRHAADPLGYGYHIHSEDGYGILPEWTWREKGKDNKGIAALFNTENPTPIELKAREHVFPYLNTLNESEIKVLSQFEDLTDFDFSCVGTLSAIDSMKRLSLIGKARLSPDNIIRNYLVQIANLEKQLGDTQSLEPAELELLVLLKNPVGNSTVTLK